MLTILTAGESEAQQARCAGALAERGIGPGDRVVFSLPGSAPYVSAVLGALRSEVIAVPLDPRLTDWERGRILDDVEPALVVEDPEALTELLAGSPTELAAFPRSRPMHFTSGTTGRPKGVWSGLLDDDQSAAAVREERQLWGLRGDDLHLIVSPVYHSAPLRFAIGTLLAGGSLAVLPRFDAAELSCAAREIRPTSMFCVPAHLQRLFEHIDAGHRFDASSFRLVAHAGAPCPDGVRRRAHALFGPGVVWEFYGSTEGQFTACPASDWAARPGTVGQARPGRVITTDDDGQLWCAVPPWARFEYWGDPEKTAAAWKHTAAGPAFTVGDVGWVDEGWVYLNGRRSDLIISGGVNVYPLEVEAALEDLVDDIAVFARPDDRWGQRVCAAYVGNVDEQELRRRAEDRLSPPKRPKEYERRDALPRTATGKVRRTQL